MNLAEAIEGALNVLSQWSGSLSIADEEAIEHVDAIADTLDAFYKLLVKGT